MSRPTENTSSDIDEAVSDFTIHMKHKLLMTRHRSHWSTLDTDLLFDRLREELEELRMAIVHGDRKAIVSEAADVGNFAMMIADNAQWGGTRDWNSHEGK